MLETWRSADASGGHHRRGELRLPLDHQRDPRPPVVAALMPRHSKALAELDVGKHSAKQMSVVIAKHMQLDDAMALAPAEVVKIAKERLRNGDEPTSPVAKPGKGEVKRQLIEIRDALMAADKVQPAPTEVSLPQKKATKADPVPPAWTSLSQSRQQQCLLQRPQISF